jgi:hypothetical protein
LPHSPNVFYGAMLRDDREALQRRVEELEKVIELLNRNRIE